MFTRTNLIIAFSIGKTIWVSGNGINMNYRGERTLKTRNSLGPKAGQPDPLPLKQSNKKMAVTSKEAVDNQFTITLLNMGNNTHFDSAFEKAKKRWEEVITNDLENITGMSLVFHKLTLEELLEIE